MPPVSGRPRSWSNRVSQQIGDATALVGPTVTIRARIATATLGSILFLASCGTTPTGVISGAGPAGAPAATRAPSTQPTATPRPVTSTVTDTDDLATSTVTDVTDAATELPIELTSLDNIDLDAVFRRGVLRGASWVNETTVPSTTLSPTS